METNLFCRDCGNQVNDSAFCPKCGSAQTTSEKPTRKPDRMWYLFPIFMGLLGGLIAYFNLRKEMPGIAKNCLIIGTIVSIVGFAFVLMLS